MQTSKCTLSKSSTLSNHNVYMGSTSAREHKVTRKGALDGVLAGYMPYAVKTKRSTPIAVAAVCSYS